jgi:hypothetical protein
MLLKLDLHHYSEQSEKMRQVQEALGQPVGYSADLDEVGSCTG